MDFLLTALVFFLVFSVLILVHEFGHFIMAKRAGIKVEEFGFGLPPRIWGKKKGETIYSINLIPFGGFVRMLGEDSKDARMLRSKRSFLAQPIRARLKVIVAGVIMNFLLAWLLLTVGFTAGMQPLLGPEDVLPAVDSGVVQMIEGVKVKEISLGSVFDEVGMKNDDVIFSYNGEDIGDAFETEIFSNPAGVYKVVRDGKIYTYEISDGLRNPEEFKDEISFYDYTAFPRTKIYSIDKASDGYKAGLREGDAIITVNGRQVYSVEDFEILVRGADTLEYEVYREGGRQKIIVEVGESRRVIISKVLLETPAAAAGFKPGDVIVSVNGSNITDSLELIKFVEEHAAEKIAYLIERNGQRLFYEVTPKNGKIGVLLSELMTYGSGQKMSLYDTDVVSSVVDIREEKYPFYVSIYKSLTEEVRLSKLTATMFVSFVKDFFSSGEVPESVSGPVGIARLTSIFVHEGLVPLIRFVAILSLSLAVINILPFPALDGGRLLFLFIEVLLGRRISQKWEASIHAFGYFLIIILILAVTYSDISKLIQGNL